jgi:YD repeat-containing protein
VLQNQYDPLAQSGDEDTFEVRLSTRYYAPADTTSTWYHSKAKRQCFASASCDGAGDLEYHYPYQSLLGGLSHTEVKDHRGPVLTTSQYHFKRGVLEFHSESAGGLARETTSEVYDGLVLRTTYPDGRCVKTTYVDVNGVKLPATTRERTAASCLSDLPANATDRVTHRTYEEFGGRVKATTGPEAFPSGVVPEPFDPQADGIREYTTFYDYDYDEGYPQAAEEACSAWGLTCPPDPENLNGDASDDLNWFGNVVRVRREVQSSLSCQPTATLETTLVYQPGIGRLLRRNQPDGTSVRHEYYLDAGDPAAWDWRTAGVGHSPAGSGPLAVTAAYATDEQSLATRHAWSGRQQEIATEGPDGIRTVRSFAASGALLTETVTCGAAPCDATQSLHSTHHTFDLRGRRLWTRTEDANQALLAAASTSYDHLDRPVTQTLDPDPSVLPGEEGSNPAYLHLMSRTYYDGLSRVKKTASPEGREVCFTYDGLGRLTKTRAKEDPTGDEVCAASEDDPVSSTDYDIMDRPVIQTDPEGIQTYFWYDAYGRGEFTSDGRPIGVAVFDPVFAGSEPQLPTDSAWWAQVSYDLAGRPARNLFHGRSSPGASPGFLQASWSKFDTAGRVTEAQVGIAPGYLPDTVDDQLTPPTGVTLATAETCHDGVRVDRTVDAGGRSTRFVYDTFGRTRQVLRAPSGTATCTITSQACTEDSDCPAEESCAIDRVEAFYDAYGRAYRTTSTTYDPDRQPLVVESERTFDAWGRVVRETGSPEQ